MSAIKVGDVARSRVRFGRLPTSVRDICPACRCFVSRKSQRCGNCGTEFTPLTEGYAQVTSLGSQ